MMTTNHENAVKYMLRTFNLNYTGFRIDDKGSKIKLWMHLLSEYTPDVINATTGHIIATRNSNYGWAPDIATVREQCLDLSSGMLSAPTGAESWQRIMAKVQEPSECENRLKLTDEENNALEQTMGKNAIYDLKHGNVQSMSFARRDYIAAFNTIVAKQRLEILTPASVKALAARNAPELPAPESKQLPQAEAGKPMGFKDALDVIGPQFTELKGVLGKIREE